MSSKNLLAVAPERVARLVNALSFASADMFDHPDAKVEIAEEDDFGTLESAFGLFLAELAHAKEELRASAAAAAATRDELQAKLSTIEHQQLTIRELSTPILDVAEGVLMLPVVGAIDTERATEMTEQLLSRVVERGARSVLLDVTGVESIDTATADHLMRLTRSAGLLGARCFVTGISPAVASTLVGMGGDLGGLKTLRSLREGLRYCLEMADGG